MTHVTRDRSKIVLSAAAALLALATVGGPALAEEPTTPLASPTAESPEATGWTHTRVVGELQRPWAVAFLPKREGAKGLDMLVTERPGRLRVIRDGKLEKEPVRGVPEVFASNQGGLLDVVLHPQFEKNQFIYLTYSSGTQKANRTRLARARFTGGALEDFKVIFEATPDKGGPLHFGSRVLFLPDGTLLLSIGDGYFNKSNAQKTSTHLGKVLRLNDDGTPAKDNPTLPGEGAKAEVYSFGHRNIQGMALDQAGRIWATEHGARGGDELNIIRPGVNYGWPLATFSIDYSGEVISENRSLPGMENAAVVWVPCIAPSGLACYTGDAFPQWKGDLFAGGLVAKQVRRIDLDETGKVLRQETLSLPFRVRDVRQGPDGLLYLVNDEERGGVFRIEPAGGGR